MSGGIVNMKGAGQTAEGDRDPRLLTIWRQREIPAVVRSHKCPRVLVSVPDIKDGDAWLRGEHRGKPLWDTRFKCRTVPKSWFDDVIERALHRFGRVYVIQPYREHQTCAPACWNALGHTCECSCLGANHGAGHPGTGWREIAETFAFQWGQLQYGCRLLHGVTGSGTSPSPLLVGGTSYLQPPSRGRVSAAPRASNGTF